MRLNVRLQLVHYFQLQIANFGHQVALPLIQICHDAIFEVNSFIGFENEPKSIGELELRPLAARLRQAAAFQRQKKAQLRHVDGATARPHRAVAETRLNSGRSDS